MQFFFCHILKKKNVFVKIGGFYGRRTKYCENDKDIDFQKLLRSAVTFSENDNGDLTLYDDDEQKIIVLLKANDE